MEPKTNEPKPADPGAPGDKPADPIKPAAPESYTFTAPNGAELDKSVVDRATPIFRELGLDQAGAQKLVDLYSSIAQENLKLVDNLRTEWREAVLKDPEMGSKVDSIKADIGRMKDATLGPRGTAARDKFDAAMDLTGAGDNPDIVRAWWKASERWREGTHVSGTAPSKHGQTPGGASTRPSLAEAMYPNLPH